MKELTTLLTLILLSGCATTKVYFSPEGHCDQVLISHLQKAKKSVDIAVYSLTRDELTEAILEAHNRGIQVRVIIDRQQAGLESADDERLENAGVPLIRDTHGGLMHNKFVVIDGKTVITGSYNWTDNATFKNDENLVILRGVGKTFSRKFEQIWNDMKNARRRNDE